MSLLQRVGSFFKKRSNKPADDDDRWYSTLFSIKSQTGAVVTPETAVGTAAVYAATTAIAQTIGSMPLITYKKLDNGGRDRAIESPFYYLFSMAPNDWMPSSEWVEMMVMHLLLRGNSYNFILRDRSGKVEALMPLHPSRMIVEQLDDLSVAYTYTFLNGKSRTLSQREILHIRFGISDGLVGKSPITIARETAALAISMENFAGAFFGNMAKPSGVLTHPAKLNKDASDRIRSSWQEMHTGLENAFKIAVLEEGMTFQAIQLNAEDSQFVEQRRFQLEDVARIYRVPPHLVGDLSHATFSNIEQQGINFIVYTLQPYLKRIEQSIGMKFFEFKVNGKDMYVEFLVDGLLRGDSKSRNESYEIQRRNGIISANEWRRLENLTPIADPSADRYMVPLANTWADLLEDATTKETPEPEPQDPNVEVEEEDPAVEEDEAQRALPAPKIPLMSEEEKMLVREGFVGILSRLIYKEEEALGRLLKKENASSRSVAWMEEHEATCRSAIYPHLKIYACLVGRVTERAFSEKITDVLWADFWKAYTSSAGKEERAKLLSCTLCDSVELVYGLEQKALTDDIKGQNGTA